MAAGADWKVRHHRSHDDRAHPTVHRSRELAHTLRARGHAVLAPAGLQALTDVDAAALESMRATWNALPPDTYLRDGGRYRRRRHSCFVVEVAVAGCRTARTGSRSNTTRCTAARALVRADGRGHRRAAGVDALLRTLAAHLLALKGAQPWFVEAHQFRIDTTDGIGRPTPEGAHRDGVDFVVVALSTARAVKRRAGCSTPAGRRASAFTMTEP
jgi:hypothetical protein